jgi:hypothetical protein
MVGAVVKVFLILAFLTIPLAACTSPGAPGVSDTLTSTADMAEKCPPSVRQFEKDLCKKSAPLFTATFTQCPGSFYQYEATGPSGVPDEWNPVGQTPLTKSIYIQSYFCTSGQWAGHSLSATNLAVVAGNPGQYPTPPASNVSWAADYGITIYSDNPVLVDYLNWKGYTAELAVGTLTNVAGLTTTWTGVMWSMTATCIGSAPGGLFDIDFFHWHGALASPLTLKTAESQVDTGQLAAGNLQATGGLIGGHVGPLGTTAVNCNSRTVPTMAISLL